METEATQGDDFGQLLSSVLADTSKIDQLTDDQVSGLRKHINPYGRTLEGTTKKCCVSVVNMGEEYQTKVLTTSLIAYLYRGCDEWNTNDNEPPIYLDDLTKQDRLDILKPMYANAVPARRELARLMKENDDIIAKERDAYLKLNPRIIEQSQVRLEYLQQAEKNGTITKSETKELETWEPWEMRAIDKPRAQMCEEKMRVLERMISRAEDMTKRIVVREFLDYMFKYNPDQHVRGAYGFNPLDPTRKEVKTPIAKASSKSWKKKSSFDPKPTAIGKHETELTTNKPGDDAKSPTTTDAKTANGNSDLDCGIHDEVTKEQLAEMNEIERTTHQNIPPADMFARFRNYMNDHYNQIRDVVNDLYHEKSDFELAINVFDPLHSTDDEAKKFVRKHEDEFIWDINTFDTNTWNLLGPFRQNRERTDLYGKNAGIITGYLDQVEKDKKTGRELMKKKVQRKKKVDIQRGGADSRQFRRYKKEYATTAESLGAVDLSDYKRQQEIYDQHVAAARKERERLANLRGDASLSERAGTDRAGTKKMQYPESKISETCPDNGIQVDVINMTQGGLNVEQTNFFTEATEPENITMVGKGSGD